MMKEIDLNPNKQLSGQYEKLEIPIKLNQKDTLN